MKLDRVIVRTIVNTLCAIAILCTLLVLSASLVFPSTMMGISYKLGNDSGAMKYAYTAYSRTGEVAYIAYATDVAFGADDDEDIALYGEAFVNDEDFLQYCSETDALYDQPAGSYCKYVYGRVVVSLYKLGEKQKSFEYAVQAVENGFEENNALVALFVESLVSGDFETADKVETEFLKVLPTLSEDIKDYVESLLAVYESAKGNA